MLIAYTDGACTNGYGGWGAVVDGEDISGMHYPSSNNLMEMQAIYEVLTKIPAHSEVTIFTDSKLAIGWLQRGWNCNKDYILQVRDAIVATLEGKCIRLWLAKVKGHSNVLLNERADALAVEQSALCRSRYRN